jgi:prevent-host-death family protein
MIRVNIHEAKTHLSKLIEKVQKGEDVIIAKGNKPVAKLTLIEELKPERRTGTAKGKVHISDKFEAPIEDFGEYTP